MIKNLKINIYIISAFLLLGVLFWFIDSAFCSFVLKTESSFIDMLVLKIPPYNVFIRIVFILVCLIAGLLVSRIYRSKREIEAELLNNYRKYLEAIIKTSNDGIFVIDKNGNFEFGNDATFEILGWKREELIGQSFMEVMPPDVHEFILQRWEEVQRGEGKPYEVDIVKKDGSRVYLFVSHKDMELSGERKHCVVMKDVTEHKQAEKELKKHREKLEELFNERTVELQKSEKKLRSLFEDSADSVLLLENGRFVDCNQATVDMLHMKSKEQLINCIPSDISPEFQPDGKLSEKKAVEMIDIAYTKGNHRFDWIHTRFDGEDFPVEVMLTSIKEHDVQYFHVVWRDITERKQAEESLRESEERLRTKIDYILSPDKDVKDFTLTDLVDLENLQQIQDAFAITNDVASIISDVNGKPITKASNFCGVCKIIRSTEKGNRNCIKSDKILGEKAKALMKPTYEKCHSCGFVDASAPIIVGGKHIANWLIGQSNVMGVCKERIETYAKEIGADTNEMINAFEKMPQMSLTKFEQILNLLWYFTKELSILGYNNLKLAKNITDIKQSEEALQESEERFRQVAESAEEWIWEVDDTALYTYASPIVEKLLGYKPEEIVGKKHSYDLFFPDDIEPLKKATLELFAEKKPLFRFLNRNVHKNGQIVWLSTSGVPILDNKGKLVGYRGTDIDITEQKKAEAEIKKHREHLEELVKERTEELEAVNKELEAFSYSVSHDLRAPLRTIDGFSKIILEDYSDTLDKQGKHYLQRVRANTQNMAKLIDDLLSLSRIGRQTLNIKSINLKTIVNELYKGFEDEWKNRKINFVVHDCPTANCDQNLIQNIIINLLSNALKYTRNKEIAEIEFGYNEKDNQIIFFIKDNGVGFDMKYANKMFSPFQRFHHTDEYEGSGIGLAIVQRIINRHGGNIWAESEPGKGTTFYFTL